MSRSLDERVASQKAGWSLEREFYTGADVFERDVEEVVMKSWLYAGHVARIPNPGDYFLYPIAGESLIVIRGEDHQVHALFNVCRHRGSVICTEPCGNRTRLVCPYHQWVYRPDGTLASARLMPEIRKEEFALAKARVRICEGLIFVHLSDGEPGFDGFERGMSARLKIYGLDKARIAHEASYEVKANWKLVLENSRECYHCGKGHPQYVRAVGFAAAVDSARAADEDGRKKAERDSRLKEMGIVTEPIPYGPGTWFHTKRFSLRDGYLSESMDGRPVAPLLGSIRDPDIGGMALVMLPNLLLEISSDYAMALRFTPSTPLTTHAQAQWFVRGDAVEGRDYDIPRLTEFWRLTCEQDWKLCEDNQAGVQSRRYQPGPYAAEEKGVRHFIDWYLARIGHR